MTESRSQYAADNTAFAVRIARGEVPDATPERLDALLHWLAGRRNAAADSIAAGFESSGISPDSATQCTLVYLDAVLFAHYRDPYRLFGLTPDCDLAAIRARHKRLLQVFHPDRHSEHQAWFTERSERINRAYAYLKAHHTLRRSATASPSAVPQPSPKRPRTPTSGTRAPSPAPRAPWHTFLATRTHLRHYLKSHLGTPETLERRLYIVLVAIPVLLLTIVYLKHLENQKLRQPKTLPAVPEQATHVSQEFAGRLHPLLLPRLQVVHASREDVAHVEARRPSAFEQSIPAAQAAMEPSVPGAALAPTPAALARDAAPATTAPALPSQAVLVPPDVVIARVQEPVPEKAQHEPGKSPATRAKTSTQSKSVTRKPAKAETRAPDTSRNTEIVAAAREPTITRASGAPASEPRAPNPDLAAIRSLLRTYQLAYNRSNTSEFAALFQQNAKTNHASSQSEIAAKYASLFHRTTRRDLAFEHVRIENLGRRRYRVKTQYTVNWTYPDGKTKNAAGQVEMRLVMVNEKPKIERMNYEGSSD